MSEVLATIPRMTRTVPRSSPMLPPIALTPEQAAAVAVALAAQPEGPYAEDGRTALDAVLASLEPDPVRRAALAATTRLVRRRSAGSEARSAVEEALARRRVLVLRYRDGEGAVTQREVEPQLVARTPEHEYLVAWCRARQAVRWFRLDRIEGGRVTGEPAPRRDPAAVGAPPAAPTPHPTHPAGRARGRREPDPRPRLVLLPGGRQG
jgi:predicted DNA-binding transcriptional regulator YafY